MEFKKTKVKGISAWRRLIIQLFPKAKFIKGSEGSHATIARGENNENVGAYNGYMNEGDVYED